MTQYSGVYTLQQQGQALTSGQWATDPYYKNTTLLLHADGVAGGAQNNSFIDSSTNNFVITRNGNTTQGSFTPYGPDWSTYFPNGSYQTVGGQDFGTGNFTVEFWVYIAEAVDSEPVVFGGEGTGSGMMGAILNTGSVRIGVTATSWNITSPTGVVSMFAWNHIAIVRSGTGTNQTSIYVNGNSVVTGTFSLNCTDTAFDIQRRQASVLADNAYFSNLRITKNAVYSGNFTPSTTPLTAISGTSLLMCQSNRFIDNSGNNYTINRSGTQSIQRFSPFPPQYQYTPAVIGGSAYFDGSGDYLSVANGSGLDLNTSFTVECWIYRTSSADMWMLTRGGGAAAWNLTNGYEYVFIISGGDLYWQWNNAGSLTYFQVAQPSLNAWHHIAVGYNGTTTRMWVDGASVASGTGGYSLPTTRNLTYVNNSVAASVATGTGYINDLRIVKGTDVYGVGNTTITVPTAPLTAVANTSLLLSATNAGIYDNAMMNDLETVGDAQVSTAVVKYGSGSMYFDGSGDYLTCPSTVNAAFGTGDFTIECWVNFSDAVERGVFQISSTSSYFQSTAANQISVERVSSGDVYLGCSVGFNKLFGNAKTGTWYHIAIVRNSGVISGFLNGVQGYSVADTYNYSTNYIVVGGFYSTSYLLNGYIDDFRITKGVARYTGNFIPPKVAMPNQ